MSFTIPCATFVRLAPVALQPGENMTPNRPFLSCVRLENRSGTRYAIASNSRIFALERLGPTDDPDGGFNVPLTMLEPCRKEANMASTLTINNMVAKTSFGFMTVLAGTHEYVDWHKHMPVKIAAVANAAMLLDVGVARLVASAPSGAVITQRFFDYKKPMVVRDIADPNWFGMFYDASSQEIQTPADVPEWL